MHLKSIELAGFKSFAKKSVLEFNSSISAIVGPNGSGKSNIAEAFRFVLGEQSIKSMRGKRGEDLIFNGTPEAPRANRASVKVVFDNSSKLFSIDFPEVTIERVVHRDGVNEYSINGSIVRLKDVIELLAQAHIGGSGHHIISQGEADRILNASPRERRSMIEDALGLKIYQYKKEESNRKLEKTGENIREAESLRREIAPHIRFLKKQVEKIEKVKELRESLKVLYSEYLSREDLYLVRARKSIEERSAPIRERLETLDAELAAAHTVLSSKNSGDERSSRLLSLQTEMKKFRTERDGMVRDLGRIEGEIAAAKRLLERHKREIVERGERKVNLSDVEELGSAVEKKIAEASRVEDLGALKHALQWIRDRFARFIEEKAQASISDSAGDLESDIERLESARADLDKKIHDIKNQEQVVSLEYEILKMEIEKEKDTSRDAEKEVFRIQADQNEALSKQNSVVAEDEKLRLEEENFKRELSEATTLIGRDALGYKEFMPADAESEPRSLQEDRRRELEKTKIRLEDAGIGGFEETMKEYEEVTGRDQFLEKELADLYTSAETLKELIADLERKMDEEFKAGVEKINLQFREYFALMFGGGSAELTIIKEVKRKRVFDEDLGLEETESGEAEEEVEEGIDVSVSLPRKKIKGLMMLSGGERALTSIALLFAVSQVNPPPFIILDETDAALDEANSKKYGDMVENLSQKSQLIVITHNRETMSRAGILYGVTMGRGGISTLLSIKFEEAVAVAK